MWYSNDIFHYAFKAEFVTLVCLKVPSGMSTSGRLLLAAVRTSCNRSSFFREMEEWRVFSTCSAEFCISCHLLFPPNVGLRSTFLSCFIPWESCYLSSGTSVERWVTWLFFIITHDEDALSPHLRVWMSDNVHTLDVVHLLPHGHVHLHAVLSPLWMSNFGGRNRSSVKRKIFANSSNIGSVELESNPRRLPRPFPPPSFFCLHFFGLPPGVKGSPPGIKGSKVEFR